MEIQENKKVWNKVLFSVFLFGVFFAYSSVNAACITFTKEDYADSSLEENQDRITDNVWITRGNNQGIYNAVVEDVYDNDNYTSPVDTEWSWGECGSDPANKEYFAWAEAVDYSPPDAVGENLCLHLITDDLYYNIEMLEWTSGSNGGGFSYERCAFFGTPDFYPLDNELNVSADANLTISFEKNIYAGAGNIEIKKISDDSIAETISVTSNGITGWGTNSITINPENFLPFNTELYINIDEGAIKDVDDNEYLGINSISNWNFITRPGSNTFSFNEDFNFANLGEGRYIDSENTSSALDSINNQIKIPGGGKWSQMDGVTLGYDNISNSAGDSQYSSFVIDNAGNPIIAWSDDTAGSYQVYISNWNGTEWAQMDDVTPGYNTIIFNARSAIDFQIAIDGTGFPILFCHVQSGDDWSIDSSIYVSRWNGSEWTGLANAGLDYDDINESGFSNSGSQVIIDNSGYPVVMFDDGGRSRLTRWNGSSWTKTDGITLGIDDEFPFNQDFIFTLDSAGYPIIAGGVSSWSDIDLAITRWNGEEWTRMDGATLGYEYIPDSGPGEQAQSYGIVIDNLGNPIVVWSESDDIFISRWNGTEWTKMDGVTYGYENISNTEDTGSPIIILDNNGFPIVTWYYCYLNTCDVFISRWNGSEWTKMNGITPGNDNISAGIESSDGSYPSSIMLDNFGYPIVAFDSQPSLRRDIFVSRWNGSYWSQMDGVTSGYDNISNNEGESQSATIVSKLGNPCIVWRDEIGENIEVFFSGWFPDNISSSSIQSIKINGLLEGITKATLTASSTTPGASRIEYFLSNNGGSSWTQVESGEELTFDTPGNDLRWKAILYAGSSPILDLVTINYSIPEDADEEDESNQDENNNIQSSPLPPQAYQPPSLPSISNVTSNNFQIIINNGDEVTTNREVELKLTTGDDTNRMAISENSNFKDSAIINYESPYKYILSKEVGLKTIYARFYTKYGQYTQKEISDSIELKNKSAEEDGRDEECMCKDRENVLPQITSESNLVDKQEATAIETVKEKEISKKYISNLINNYNSNEITNQKILYFVAHGTKSTIRLGEGERAGVVNSFISAFNRLPSSQVDWEDIIKIANGRWPSQKDKQTELNAIDAFKKIYERNPNRSNSFDEAAVIIIAYGLRPCERNLDSETQAIKTFRNTYGYSPKNASAWDIVRAIAYSGSKR